MTARIRTAYSISRKCGLSYLARAFVKHGDTGDTFKLAIGDTAEEAVNEAVAYVIEQHHRDGLTAPEEVIHVGRVSEIIGSNFKF